MQVEVKLPPLGEGEDVPNAANLCFWYVDVGGTVGEGDSLVQFVTDKAAFDVPSPVSGTLVEIRAEEADTVDVGAVVAVIETDQQGGAT